VGYCWCNERTAKAAARTRANVLGDVEAAPDCTFPVLSKGLPPPLWSFVVVCFDESEDEVEVDVEVGAGAALVSTAMAVEEAGLALLDVGAGAGLEAAGVELAVLKEDDVADVALVSIAMLEATELALLATAVPLAPVDGAAEVRALEGAGLLCALLCG